MGLQERPGAGECSLCPVKLRRGRLEDVPYFGRNVKLDGDVSRSRSGSEARSVIQQHLIGAALDEKWGDPVQIGEQRTERAARRICVTRVVGDVASEPIRR